MTFWPYRKYELTSKLSSDQLRIKFEPSHPYIYSGILTKTFTNSYNTDSFSCSLHEKYLTINENVGFKIGGYMNSFRPEAKIQFQQAEELTTYIIAFRPKLWTILFVLFVAVFLSAAFTTLIIKDIQANKINVTSFLPILMILFMYIIVIAGFNADLPQLDSFVFDLLEIETEN